MRRSIAGEPVKFKEEGASRSTNVLKHCKQVTVETHGFVLSHSITRYGVCDCHFQNVIRFLCKSRVIVLHIQVLYTYGKYAASEKT
jgi:2-C-methyl-D-erythritol 4-phosphate cytidylyltransferase